MKQIEYVYLAIWMWLTQQNGKGPRRYLGLVVIEWFLLVLAVAAVASAVWMLK